MSTGEECTNCLLVLVAEQRLLADCTAGVEGCRS